MMSEMSHAAEQPVESSTVLFSIQGAFIAWGNGEKKQRKTMLTTHAAYKIYEYKVVSYGYGSFKKENQHLQDR